MRPLYLFITLFIGLNSQLLAQQWEWLKPLHEKQDVYPRSLIRTNAQGDILIADYPAGATQLKFFDSSGQLTWQKMLNGITVTDMCFDSSGNIWFCGELNGVSNISGINFQPSGTSDGIVFLTDNQFNLIKHRVITTSGKETINSLALSNGSVLLAGTFNKSFILDGIFFAQSDAQNVFVIKTDLNLNLISSFQTKSSCCMGSGSLKVAVTDDQSVYLLAEGDSFVRIGNDSLYFNDEGQFLCKLSSSLQVQWSRILINHFMYGRYLPYLKFDTLQNPVTIYREGGGGGSPRRIIATKHSSAVGTQQWSTILPMNYEGVLASDNQNQLWVAGNFYSPIAHVCFSIIKLNHSGTITNVIRDSSISHHILGFATKTNSGFYVKALCNSGTLGDFSCVGQDSTFLSYYGSSSVVSVTEQVPQKEILVYPNPSSGKFSIQIDQLFGKNVKVEILNVLGEKIRFTQSYPNNQMELDLRGNAKGIYFVQLLTENKKTNTKIVLE